MLKFLVVDGFHTDKKLPIRLRLKLSRAVDAVRLSLTANRAVVLMTILDRCHQPVFGLGGE
jgi:hypothetical protein